MAKKGEDYDKLMTLVIDFLDINRIDYEPSMEEIDKLDPSCQIKELMDETNATTFDFWCELELQERTKENVLYSMILRTMYKEEINYIPSVFQMIKHDPDAMLCIMDCGDLLRFAKEKGLYTYDEFNIMKERKK